MMLPGGKVITLARKRNARSDLYKAARLMGDVEAAEHGPEALAKREARKSVYRSTNRSVSRFLRALGLSK